MTTPTFRLPELRGALTAARHPLTALLIEESDAWARKNLAFLGGGEVARLLEQQLPLWTGMVYTAGAAERVRDVCDITYLFAALDDDCDGVGPLQTDQQRARAVFAGISAVFDDPEPDPAAPYAVAFADIWRRVSAQASPDLRDRLGGALRRIFDVWAEKIGALSNERAYDMATYLRMRPIDVMIKFWLLLYEYTLDIELGRLFVTHPEVTAAEDPAIRHLYLVNDLLSYRQEYYGDHHMNIVAVLRQEGVGRQDAVDRTCELIAVAEQDFLAARDRIRTGELGSDPVVCAYLLAIEHLVSGSLDWSYLSSRYHGAGYQWNGLTSGIVIMHPEITEILAG
ncbi:terpene synthase family protein [Nocardia sp. NBC_01388]|uniref:terpene synthase family protein n=1 Tax=Nocardia sp. NBC_01388 TaxID=2903596 RepID=UPI003254715E